MSTLKTITNDKDVLGYIQMIEDDQKRQDCLALLELFQKITLESPKMWGTSIIWFGSYHYKSERSTQEGDCPITGFAPRQQNISIYLMPGIKQYPDLLGKLGKYKTGVSCLYIKKLSDIDESILEQLIRESVRYMRETYR